MSVIITFVNFEVYICEFVVENVNKNTHCTFSLWRVCVYLGIYIVGFYTDRVCSLLHHCREMISKRMRDSGGSPGGDS